MTKEEFERLFWHQYLFIENEMIKAMDYISPDTLNFSTFSPILQKIILQAGSEIDNVFREITQLTGKRIGISDYIGPVQSMYPKITKQTVHVTNSDIILIPFGGWNQNCSSKSLAFWEVYNLVKHQRLLHYTKASFENALNAVAGLFVVEMYYMKTLYEKDPSCMQSIPEKKSELFFIELKTHVRTSVALREAENLVVAED